VRAERFPLDERGDVSAGKLAATIRALSPAPPNVGAVVADVIAAVRERGDAAVVEFARRFDNEEAPSDLRLSPESIERALRELDPPIREGLKVAAENVRLVSEAELSDGATVALPQGQRVELRELAVRRAGAYVPGGRAAYPSSVVMCCVPARVAGVEQVVVATPPAERGNASPAVLAACALCDVDEVYVMGGAQAIAALAYGTESVEPVDVIVGPGSHYVQEAKRQVVGTVGIDGVAGPTELVVVADADADAGLVALDIGAQAEHGDDSLLVLVSPSRELLADVAAEIDRLETSHETISNAPLALVEASDITDAVELADAIAPEHLQLVCAGADSLASSVRASGCVFVGSTAGTAFGDYVVGSNHVLPTGGAARFSGPLGIASFRRRQALVSLSERAAERLAPHVSSVARTEGFPVHAESAEARSPSREDQT
jgi:histidinol dehydrogenase